MNDDGRWIQILGERLSFPRFSELVLRDVYASTGDDFDVFKRFWAEDEIGTYYVQLKKWKRWHWLNFLWFVNIYKPADQRALITDCVLRGTGAGPVLELGPECQGVFVIGNFITSSEAA